MSTALLAVLVLGPTAMVVVALFLVLWWARRSTRDAWVAAISGVVLAVWAIVTTALAARGVFIQPDSMTAPPVAIDLVVVLLVLAVCLVASKSLRRLLTNQKHLIRLNVWRLEGLVFLLLMALGQMPALWALPAGIGDVIVGSTAFWVASQLDAPGGRRRAIMFNLFGVADLLVAIALGVTTNTGPAQLFHTSPTSELVTRFPLVLVPTFLVPLAFMLHVVSLWQSLGRSWSADRIAASA
jgi:hypothetical protein